MHKYSHEKLSANSNYCAMRDEMMTVDWTRQTFNIHVKLMKHEGVKNIEFSLHVLESLVNLLLRRN